MPSENWSCWRKPVPVTPFSREIAPGLTLD